MEGTIDNDKYRTVRKQVKFGWREDRDNKAVKKVEELANATKPTKNIDPLFTKT